MDVKNPEARYRVTEELHRTSTVRTFRGIDPEVSQAAAVKVIGIGSAKEAAVFGRIFRDRCSILERLDHESMPRLLDYGLTELGHAYLAFEWVEGKPASSLTPMSPRQALPLITRALEGLECLALHNLVHWNVNPDTIIVPPDGEARLVGLGVSLLPIDWWSHHSEDSVADRYVAPEFRSLDLGPTAALGGAWWKGDLYSAAMTTCDLLSAEVEGAGTEAPRVRLPTWESDPLLGVLERCLHADPARRPLSFSEVIKAFHVALAKEAGESGVIVVRGSGVTEDPTPHPAASDVTGTNLFPSLWVDMEAHDPTPSGARALRRPSPGSRPAAARTDPSPRPAPEEVEATRPIQRLDPEETEATRPIAQLEAEEVEYSLPTSEQPEPVEPTPVEADPAESELTRPISVQPAAAELTRPISVQPTAAELTRPISLAVADETAESTSPVLPEVSAAQPVEAQPEAAPPLPAEHSRSASRHPIGGAKVESVDEGKRSLAEAAKAFGDLLGSSRLRIVGASALASAALLLMLTVALWPSSEGGEAAANLDRQVRRDPPPVDEVIPGIVPPPLELRDEIALAYERFADGDSEGALAALDQLEELEDEAMLTPLECDQIAVLRESMARIDARRVEQEVRLALTRGDRNALGRALNRVGPTQLLYLSTRPAAMSVLARGGALLAELDEYDQTVRGEQFVEAFDLAEGIASRFPAVEAALRLRERAALGVERRIDQLLEQGRWELAEQAIGLLESRWPDRPGLEERGSLLAESRSSEKRWDRLYTAAAAALEAGQPHEGLEILEGLEPPFEQVARFGDLTDELRQRMSELDASAPTVELVAEPEFRRGKTVVVQLRVADDYEPMEVKLWIATSQDAVYRQLTLQPADDGSWEGRIPPAEHRDRPITLWAEASDRSGNRGMLADAETPIEIRRRRWFRSN